MQQLVGFTRDRRVRFAILATLLLAHAVSRYAAERLFPLPFRNDGMYIWNYRVALNLMAGRGMYLSILPDVPEAAPVREFITLKREDLSRQDYEVFLRQPWARPIHFDERTRLPDTPIPEIDRNYTDLFYATRGVELHVAAWLWRLFGLRWTVIFRFYELVSVAAAFLIFVIARKAAGYWAGIVALLLYTFSPIEARGTICSIRDISPLWFGIFGFAALFCLAGSFRSQALNLISYFTAGAVAVIGYGWRLDALQLPPILLAFLIADGFFRRRGFRIVTVQAGAFCCGVAACLAFIHALTPQNFSNPQTGFHIAYYGTAERSNLLGIENSLNIFRCDISTRVSAFYYAEANHLTDNAKPYLGPAYGAACFPMYLKALQFNAWQWISRFPVFALRALRAPSLSALPIDGDIYPLDRARRILGTLSWFPLVLTILGIAAVCLWEPFSSLTRSLIAFLLIYTMALFLVLPEYKHSGLLVLPMCVLGAVGITSLTRLPHAKVRWRMGSILFVVGALLWGIASTGAYFWSVRQRSHQLETIRKATAHAAPDPSAYVSSQFFRVARPLGVAPDRAGYLLEIQTGDRPGRLIFRHRIEADAVRLYESEHALHANRRQFFFFTAFQGRLDDDKLYTATVLLDGDAQIKSALQADLTDWKGLQASTVFYDGERVAGSPTLGHLSERTIYGPGTVDADLLYPLERARLKLADRAQSDGLPKARAEFR